MIEALIGIICLLIGIIGTYYTMNKNCTDLQEKVINEILKNKLLKAELVKKPKKFKGKKRYYNNKKSNGKQK